MTAARKTDSGPEKLPGTLKAVSDPTRLKILLMLEGKPRTVTEIVEFFDLAQPTISRHLQTLSAAGLVTRTRQGQQVLYEVAPDRVRVMCLELANCFPACCETIVIRPIAGATCCGDSGAAKKPSRKKATTKKKTAVIKKKSSAKPAAKKTARKTGRS